MRSSSHCHQRTSDTDGCQTDKTCQGHDHDHDMRGSPCDRSLVVGGLCIQSRSHTLLIRSIYGMGKDVSWTYHMCCVHDVTGIRRNRLASRCDEMMLSAGV